MKLAITLLLCSITILSQAQDCSINFIDSVFGVQVETDVLYGSANDYTGQNQDLFMNIFKPVGDGQTERPVMLFIHGGAFIAGTRDELDDICITYASRGYVCATMSYRLGFYAPNNSFNPFSYDAAEVTRAAYRSMQDARGAVRFLKGRSVQDSSSVDQFYIGGFSAGAISALHLTYVTDPGEKPVEAGAIADVMHTFNSYPRPDLGSIEGDIAVNAQTSSVKGCVSFFGGLLDTALIDSPQDPALFLYHQTGDPTVGCDYQQGLWGAPFGVGANYPYLYGSCVMQPRITNLGFAPEDAVVHLYNGNEHNVHDYPLLDLEVANFLADHVCAPVGISELDQKTTAEVWPNPSNGEINVSIDRSITMDRLQVLDLSGRQVWQVSMNRTDRFTIQLNTLQAGQYVIRAFSGDAVVFSEPITLIR